jgi:hypothetical protein
MRLSERVHIRACRRVADSLSRRFAKYPSGTPRSPFRCVQAGPRRLAQELEEASAEPKQFALASRPMRQTPSGRRWTSARARIVAGSPRGPMGVRSASQDRRPPTDSPAPFTRARAHQFCSPGPTARSTHQACPPDLPIGSRNRLSRPAGAISSRYQVSRIAYQWPETRRHDMSKPRSSAGPSSIHPQNPASRKPLSSIANRIDSTTR